MTRPDGQTLYLIVFPSHSVAVSNFVYFYSFHGLKTLARAESQTAVKDLLYACCAGKESISDC